MFKVVTVIAVLSSLVACGSDDSNTKYSDVESNDTRLLPQEIKLTTNEFVLGELAPSTPLINQDINDFIGTLEADKNDSVDYLRFRFDLPASQGDGYICVKDHFNTGKSEFVTLALYQQDTIVLEQVLGSDLEGCISYDFINGVPYTLGISATAEAGKFTYRLSINSSKSFSFIHKNNIIENGVCLQEGYPNDALATLNADRSGFEIGPCGGDKAFDYYAYCIVDIFGDYNSNLDNNDIWNKQYHYDASIPESDARTLCEVSGTDNFRLISE